jgi:hypothetical protein
LQELSRAYRKPANKRIILAIVFSSFQDIYSGCCTIAAHGPSTKSGAYLLHIYPTLLHGVLPTTPIKGTIQPFAPVLLDKDSPSCIRLSENFRSHGGAGGHEPGLLAGG